VQGVFGMVAGHQEVTLPGDEVRGGIRESAGQDPARLRGYQTVVLAVADLDGHPDLVERHTPGPGFERVVVRRSASSLPECLGHVPAEHLPEVLAPRISWSAGPRFFIIGKIAAGSRLTS